MSAPQAAARHSKVSSARTRSAGDTARPREAAVPRLIESWKPVRAAAVANALAGNMDEARKPVARILQISPTASIAHYMSINLYQQPEDIERMIGGLRRAGLPE